VATTTRTRRAQTADQDALNLFKAAWGRCHDTHEKRCVEYKRWQKAYKGFLEHEDDLHQNAVAPWYVFNIIELLASNLIDELVGKVTPRTATSGGAKLLERVVNEKREEDEFSAKQAPFVKQALICGLSPAKTSNRYERGNRTYGEYSTDVATGEASFKPVTREVTLCNRPTFTPIRADNFMWDPLATGMHNASFVLYRSYQTLAHLRQMQDAGVYRNVDLVDVNRRVSSTSSESIDPAFKQETKGTVEVVEYWTCERLITVANRGVVLRDDPNPFWHGEIPFTVAVTIPELYTLNGISQVETIIDLAKALTRALNQRLDNADLVNVGALWYDPATGNKKALEKAAFKPRALIPRENPNAWGFIETNTNIIDSSIKSEETLKGDMRDIAGSSAYVSGAASDGQLDQRTATGISIIQSMAQKRLISMVNQLAHAYKRKGRQEIALIQQFTTQPEAVRIDSRHGFEWQAYTPDDIRGEYDYAIEDAQENLNKQQRRAEATDKLQTSILMAQQALATGQKFRVPLEQAWRDYLEAWDVDDPEKYMEELPPAPMLGAPPSLPGLAGGAPSPGAPTIGGGPPPPPTGAPGPPSPPFVHANGNQPPVLA
jgi:hypothetical protein